METTESDIGYPEEQPPEVDDTPDEGTSQRKRGTGREREDDDDHATGDPKTDGD
ncbi:hypothetical protein [Solirubrobacter soli]|uniref:hypothetical protein n=1 Tax=Solirubrobacter soli TaxID=363832 RepID=UPI000401141F|nr:hypothetical protein [Solirubrobacter soli]